MAYSTRADVENRLSALPAPSTVASIDSRIDEGIEYADALIDGKLAACYAVPFASVPKLIKAISADLAAAFTLDGGFSGGGEDEPTSLSDTIRSRAMALLEQLATKELVLPSDQAPPPEESDNKGTIPNHSCLGQRPSLQDFDLYTVPESFYQ